MDKKIKKRERNKKEKITMTGKNSEKANFKIWWDDKEKIIRMKISGKMGIEEGKKCIKELDALVQKLKKKGVKHMDSLNDASEAGITTDFEFRKLFFNFLKRKEFKDIRSAMFGLGSSQRMVVNFLMGLSKERKIKCFETEKESLEWLRKAKKERDEKEKSQNKNNAKRERR